MQILCVLTQCWPQLPRCVLPAAQAGQCPMPNAQCPPYPGAAAQLGCGAAQQHQDPASPADAHQQLWRAFSQQKPNAQRSGRSAGLQAAGAARQPFLPSLPSCCLPARQWEGKCTAQRSLNLEQLSSNERFLPPQGCFIKLFVFFCWRWAKQQWKTPEIFQIKTNA